MMGAAGNNRRARRWPLPALLFGLACWSAPAMPAYAAQALANFVLQGEATMRFMGFRVYDIALWRAKDALGPDTPYALTLTYAHAFASDAIAARSIHEMRAQGISDEPRLAGWQLALENTLPDVAAHDTLIGIAYPGKHADFYAGDRFLGRIEDSEFVAAFFGIWLSENTSAPRVRAKLLAGRPW